MLRIEEKRKELGMSQAKLAELVGVSQAFVSKVEQGNSMPRVETLTKFAKALGCGLDDLVIPESA